MMRLVCMAWHPFVASSGARKAPFDKLGELQAAGEKCILTCRGCARAVGHRLEAIKRLIQKYRDAAKEAVDYDEAEKLRQKADDLEDGELLFKVYLDGNPQNDFVKLQLGKTVDPSQLLSMRVHNKLIEGEEGEAMDFAYDIARAENEDKESPFCGRIRLDTTTKARHPIASLCVKGVDQAGSFYGLARLGLHLGLEASLVCVAVNRVIEALIKTSVLATPKFGTRGNNALLLGMAAAAIYRAAKDGGRVTPYPPEEQHLVNDQFFAGDVPFCETLYGRIIGCGSDGDWEYRVLPENWSVEETVVGDVVHETCRGPADFEFAVSVRFPRSDLPAILERLQSEPVPTGQARTA